MPALRLGSPARLSCLLAMGSVIFLVCPAAPAQDDALQRAMQTLVYVSITLETQGTPLPVMELGGKTLQNLPLKLIEYYPSTGIVIDGKGHVLTFVGYRWVNIHARNPRIEIVNAQGEKHPGKLIGIDQNMRVAVISCEGVALRKTPLCEHCEIKNGVTVVVPVQGDSRISQFESAQVLSVSTSGDASRDGGWAIRINRPLSMIGAPMLDAQSQVIGVVADQMASPLPPVDLTVYPVSQLLRSANKIIKAGGDIQTGWLGVYVKWDVDSPSEAGVSIVSVEKDSPAYRAGLLPNDVMLKWNGAAIRDPRKYIQIVQDTPVGSKAVIDILRQGRPAKVVALIEARKPQDPRESLVIDVPGIMALPGTQTVGRAQSQSFLGIDLIPLTQQLADFLQIPYQPGLFVASVAKQTAFDRAGVLAGDVILNVDGISAGNPQTFYNHIKSLGSGGRLVLRLVRKGIELSKTVQLPKLPNPFRKPRF